MKYRVTFTVEKLNDHSIVLERENWKLSDWRKDKNRDGLVSEAISALLLDESKIKTFKIDLDDS